MQINTEHLMQMLTWKCQSRILNKKFKNIKWTKTFFLIHELIFLQEENYLRN